MKVKAIKKESVGYKTIIPYVQVSLFPVFNQDTNRQNVTAAGKLP